MCKNTESAIFGYIKCTKILKVIIAKGFEVASVRRKPLLAAANNTMQQRQSTCCNHQQTSISLLSSSKYTSSRSPQATTKSFPFSFHALFSLPNMSAVDQSINTSNNKKDDNKNAAKQERKRKRRWGDASKTADTAAAPAPAAAVPAAPKGPVDSKAKALALKASVAARLAALKAQTAGVPSTAAASLKRHRPTTS